jgi:hypothetical protein
VPAFRLSAPASAERGGRFNASLSFDAATPASVHVIHVDVLDPAGQLHREYSGNLLAPAGAATKPIPLAHNDPPGAWTVTARDVLTGQEKTVRVQVH